MKAFEEVLSAGKRKPSEAYRKLNVEFVDETVLRTVDPDLESFWNINTPGDLRLAEKKLREVCDHEED